jgi:hypothetical protein
MHLIHFDMKNLHHLQVKTANALGPGCANLIRHRRCLGRSAALGEHW